MATERAENTTAPWHISNVLEDWLREHETELSDRRDASRTPLPAVSVTGGQWPGRPAASDRAYRHSLGQSRV
jgi:hypothetical protein